MSSNKKRKLPDGWTKSKLSELAVYINGKAFKPEEWDKEGIPIIRIENLTNEKESFNYYKGECQDRYKVIEDDLLVSWSATLDVFIWNRGDAYLNQHIFKVEPYENKVNKKFLYFLLKYSMDRLRENIHGATMQHITKPEFDNFEVIHPKDTNKQISNTSDLECRMAHVEKMRAAALLQLDAAKAMSAALLNEIFSDETFDGYPMVRLEDWTCDIASGQAVSSVGGNYQKQGIRYIQGNNLTNEGFALLPIVYTEVETHAAMSRSVVMPKNVLINIVGPPIGKICWYPEDQSEANINQAAVRVRCPEDLDYRFLTYLLRTKKYYDYFFDVKVGSRQWNISRTNCADIKIPRIPISLQHDLIKKFEDKINRTYLVAAAERQVEAIEALPWAILREVFDFEEENKGL